MAQSFKTNPSLRVLCGKICGYSDFTRFSDCAIARLNESERRAPPAPQSRLLPDFIAHTQAVAEYAREIAERYNERHRNPADIELVIAGALLHDIGRARSNCIDHAVAGAVIA